MVGYGVGDVKLRADRRRGLPLVIKIMEFKAKETVVVNVIGTVKAIGEGQTVDMPFAGMVGSIAGWLEHCGQETSPRRTVASFDPGQSVPTHLLGVISRQQGSPGRPAAGGVVELGEAQTVLGQTIEMGCLDFPAVATKVGIPHVVRHDQQNIGRLGLSPRSKEYC